MVMTERNEKLKAPKSPAQCAAADAIKELRDSGALDGLFAKIDARLIHTRERSMHISVHVRSGSTAPPRSCCCPSPGAAAAHPPELMHDA